MLTIVGAAVSLALGISMWASPLGASIAGRHVAYHVELWRGPQMAVLYVLVTCGSLLASRQRHVNRFGFMNLVAAVGLAWLNEEGFISLWFFCAAATSVAFDAELRFNDRPVPNVVDQ